MSKLLAACGVAALLLAAPARAQTKAALDACHNQPTTLAIVDCLGKLTAQADRRLNENYQKTLKITEPEGIAAVRASERAWLEYRKQRCAYRTAGGGTIVQILGADCMATMTKARADELETDAQGMAGPG